MSGLTPILDTLLHQVFGKRGDVRPPASLQPGQVVSEVREGVAVRPLESDSRLDPRAVGPQPAARGAQPAIRSTPGAEASGASRGAVAPETEQNPASQTRLSLSAQFISRVQQAPGEASPPAVRAAGPLLGDANVEEVPASALAKRLGDSIRSSGFFYESHLGQWFRGRMPAQELAREPQMRIWLQSPMESSDGGRPAAGSASARAATVDQGLAAGEARVAAATQPEGETFLYTANRGRVASAGASVDISGRGELPVFEDASSSAPERRQVSADGQERLQLLVRSQLELLGAPVLRWEGEITDGFLMFMEIRLPEQNEDAGFAESPQKSEGSDEDGWSTSLEMALPTLGELAVVMRRSGAHFAMELVARQPSTAELLTDQLETIVSRLQALGLEAPNVRVTTAEGSDADG